MKTATTTAGVGLKTVRDMPRPDGAANDNCVNALATGELAQVLALQLTRRVRRSVWRGASFTLAVAP